MNQKENNRTREYAHFLKKLITLLVLIKSNASGDILYKANLQLMTKPRGIDYTNEWITDSEKEITEKIILLISTNKGRCAVINLFKVFVRMKRENWILFSSPWILDILILRHETSKQNIKKIIGEIKHKNLDELKLLFLFASANFKNSHDIIEVIFKNHKEFLIENKSKELEIFMTNIFWSAIMNYPDYIKHFTSLISLDKILISDYVHMSNMNKLNDPKEGIFFDEIASGTRGYIKSTTPPMSAYNLSFTTSDDIKQIPMWSLYTGMEGIRLTYINWFFNYSLSFNIEPDKILFPFSGRVIYGKAKILQIIWWINRMVKLVPWTILIKNFIFELLPYFCKVSDYKHEEEYRIVHILDSPEKSILKIKSPILKLPTKYQWSPDLEESFSKMEIGKKFKKIHSLEEKNDLNWRKS